MILYLAFLITTLANAADLSDTNANIALIFQHIVGEAGHEKALFAITNGTAKSIWYTGINQTDPFYKIEVLRSNRWAYDGPLRCGLGAKRLELPSTKTATFAVPLEYFWPPVQAIRVSLSCGPNERYKEALEKTRQSQKVDLDLDWSKHSALFRR